MPQEVTRYIQPAIERELWVRAGGRCEFPSCNRLLYKSPVTQEKVNISEKAHIHSFSRRGPRGRGPFAAKTNGLNSTANLLLVCHDCHKTIDADKDGTRYSAELLKQWKLEHEARIVRMTGISPTRKSYVLLYGSKIGEQHSPLHPDAAIEAMFPERFPAQDLPIPLSLKYEHEDHTDDFWRTEAQHLQAGFKRHVVPLIDESPSVHFSTFALADMPLLILLGSLFTDKVAVDVYQRHREPMTWRWPEQNPNGVDFLLRRPRRYRGTPVLILSLSAEIRRERITSVVGRGAAFWELTLPECHNDVLRSRALLSKFRTTVRKAMVAINAAHGNETPLHVFPAMPAACAVEFGRVRMPKADMPWIIYDHNAKRGAFTKALQVGEQHEHR